MKVYIAGPYTLGDVALNVREAILAGNRVMLAGHTPFIPHLTHFWHMLCPGDYQQWIDYDLQWVKCCDALIRLPGESNGADGEVALARELSLPVYFGVRAFINRDVNTF